MSRFSAFGDNVSPPAGRRVPSNDWDALLLQGLLLDDPQMVQEALGRFGARPHAALEIEEDAGAEGRGTVYRFGAVTAVGRGSKTESTVLLALLRKLRFAVELGDTAMHLARRLRASEGVLQALRAAGVDPTRPNARGEAADVFFAIAATVPAKQGSHSPQPLERNLFSTTVVTRGYAWEREMSRQMEREDQSRTNSARGDRDKVGLQRRQQSPAQDSAGAEDLLQDLDALDDLVRPDDDDDDADGNEADGPAPAAPASPLPVPDAAQEEKKEEKTPPQPAFRGFSWERELMRQLEREQCEGRELFRAATLAEAPERGWRSRTPGPWWTSWRQGSSRQSKTRASSPEPGSSSPPPALAAGGTLDTSHTWRKKLRGLRLKRGASARVEIDTLAGARAVLAGAPQSP